MRGVSITEFPEIPIDLSRIPNAWDDVSWHNDVCPCFSFGAFRIWCDHPVQELREIPCDFQYGISCWHGPMIYTTNDFDDLVGSAAALNRWVFRRFRAIRQDVGRKAWYGQLAIDRDGDGWSLRIGNQIHVSQNLKRLEWRLFEWGCSEAIVPVHEEVLDGPYGVFAAMS